MHGDSKGLGVRKTGNQQGHREFWLGSKDKSGGIGMVGEAEQNFGEAALRRSGQWQKRSSNRRDPIRKWMCFEFVINLMAVCVGIVILEYTIQFQGIAGVKSTQPDLPDSFSGRGFQTRVQPW